MESSGFAGGTAEPTRDGHRAAPPLTSDDGGTDLSGVDPLRRQEIRRRIAVVRSFLALVEPSDADRRRHAETLDLSLNQFKALVRAWRAYPSATSMAQSGRARGAPRATGPRHLDARARTTAEAAIAGLTTTATLVQAMEAVAAACEAHGLDVPRKTTVWKMLTAARRSQVDPSEHGVVVIGRCRLRMPVVEGDTLVMPSVALAVRAYDAAIVGATLRSDRAADAALAALALSQPDQKSLEIDDSMVTDPPIGVYAAVTVRPSSMIRRRLSRILGTGIGGVQPVYKAGAEARPERLLRSRKDRPLSQADAMAVVRAAIDAHNAERGAGRTIWID